MTLKQMERKAKAAQIPVGDIRWLVGRMHISTPDAEIAADIRKRATNPQWTPDTIQLACDYAVACMRDHRSLCRAFQL